MRQGAASDKGITRIIGEDSCRQGMAETVAIDWEAHQSAAGAPEHDTHRSHAHGLVARIDPNGVGFIAG